MEALALYLIRPDFMQIILISGLFFLLPLEKRPRWKRNALCVILLGWAAGACLELLTNRLSERITFWSLLFLPNYLVPLLCVWLLFRVCTPLPVRDAVYGAACAYAAQHGYGLKSISGIAAQYGGAVRIQTDEDIFILSVLLPLPQAGTGA